MCALLQYFADTLAILGNTGNIWQLWFGEVLYLGNGTKDTHFAVKKGGSAGCQMQGKAGWQCRVQGKTG